MIREVLKGTGWVALLGCAGVTACSNPPAIADAFVYATVGSNSSSGDATCNLGASEIFAAVGMMTNGQLPSTTTDGNSNSTITCTVAPAGDGFQISLYAHGSAGTFVVSGTATASGGTGITASFDSLAYGSFHAKNCTLSYTYQGMPVPTSAPIAATQIFAHISCPDTELTGQEVDTDGGAEPVTCDGEADFLFQNCGQ